MLCVHQWSNEGPAGRVRCWQVQRREPNTGQQKVNLYYRKVGIFSIYDGHLPGVVGGMRMPANMESSSSLPTFFPFFLSLFFLSSFCPLFRKHVLLHFYSPFFYLSFHPFLLDPDPHSICRSGSGSRRGTLKDKKQKKCKDIGNNWYFIKIK